MIKSGKLSGYKAFDKDFKCRDMQYEENKEFSIPKETKLKCCPTDGKKEGGLHFCENPLDLFEYYEPSTARFAEVEATDEHITDGNKTASKKLLIIYTNVFTN